ncbi:MAG: hypothetical protein BWY15_02282 [Firmicutes bacterium ADurb.Bin193]|nr:MAG: hypothetical protein BWY15_02282 [Firmicutes bacterium ADurb.Bin193]
MKIYFVAAGAGIAKYKVVLIRFAHNLGSILYRENHIELSDKNNPKIIKYFG